MPFVHETKNGNRFCHTQFESCHVTGWIWSIELSPDIGERERARGKERLCAVCGA